jgi:hypothetical protein
MLDQLYLKIQLTKFKQTFKRPFPVKHITLKNIPWFNKLWFCIKSLPAFPLHLANLKNKYYVKQQCKINALLINQFKTTFITKLSAAQRQCGQPTDELGTNILIPLPKHKTHCHFLLTIYEIHIVE